MPKIPKKKYQPIPVVEAGKLSEQYNKDMVIIVAWDYTHNKLHVTTFGKDDRDKVLVAAIGDQLPRHILGITTLMKEVFEDFRGK